MTPSQGTIHTDVDLLIEFVKERKEVTIEEAADALGLPLKTVEEIADFLDEEGIITIQYKLTTEYLVYNDWVSEKQQRIKEEKERLEDMFERLENDFSRGLRYVSEGNFSEAKKFYKQINQDIKAIHKELKADSKDLPSLDSYHFLVRVENVEHLLDQVDVLLERKEEQRVLAAFSRIDSEVKDIFHDLKNIYEKVTTKKTTQQQNSGVRKELLKRLKEKETLFGGPHLQTLSNEEQAQEVAISDEIKETLKTDNIDELLQQAQRFLQQGDHKKAQLLYNRVKELYEQMPKEFSTKKRQLEKDLTAMKQQLEEKTLEASLEKAQQQKTAIESLLKDCAAAMKQKDLEQAKKLFNEAKEKIDAFPNEFLALKIPLENEFFALQQSLLSLEKEIYDEKVKVYAQKIDEYIEKGKQFIEQGNMQEAAKQYDAMKTLYKEIPDGYLTEKIQLQEKIFNYYKHFLTAYKEDSAIIFKKLSERITLCLASLKKLIQEKNVEAAYALLEEIQQDFSQLPPGFFREKNDLEKQILSYSTQLAKIEKEQQEHAFRKKEEKLKVLLEELKRYLHNEEYDLARETYNELLIVYYALPPGFLLEKRKWKEQINQYYQELLRNEDKLHMNDDLLAVDAYNRLLKKIVELHEFIEDGNFDILLPTYKVITSLYNKLPIGLLHKHIRIREEILKIYDEVKAYQLTKELDNYVRDKKLSLLKGKLQDLIHLYKEIASHMVEDKRLLLYLKRRIESYVYFLKGHHVVLSQPINDAWINLINAFILQDFDTVKEILQHHQSLDMKDFLVILKHLKEDPNKQHFVKSLIFLRNKKEWDLLKLYIHAYAAKLLHDDKKSLELLRTIHTKYPNIVL